MSNYGPIYFLSEEKTPDFVDEVIHVPTGYGEWGERLLKGLSQIESDLIFYMQEDFWVNKKMTLSNEIINMFIEWDMDAYRISYPTKFYDLIKVSDDLYQYTQNSQYTLSHQFTLWKKDYFMGFIKPDESPWVNEIAGTKRINNTKHKIFFTENTFYTPTVTKGVLNQNGINLLSEIK